MPRETSESLAHRRVTIAGLGRFGGGIAVARWLVGQGARVLVTDRDPAEKLAASVAQLDGLPIDFVLGEHRERDFTDCDLLVVSPAISPTNPFIAAARRAGVSITTEIALFVERCPTRNTVGITGTKGKSTTSALLARMLETSYRTWLGGNIGVSLLDRLNEIRGDDVVVLELSSFMLHWLGRAGWSPHVAALTMIGTDHLDWHGGVAAYHDAKANVIAHQTASDVVVYDATHAESKAIAARSAGRQIVVPESLGRRLALRVPGEHNQRNAQLALAAADALGVPFDYAQAAIAEFGGLPHRLEVVHESNGVRWVNDSIATIPEAAVAANAAFEDGHVIQILGGYDKGLEMSAMCRTLASRCKAILTIGAIGPSLATKCRDAGGNAIECETLGHAVAHAKSIAAAGDVVLLSTACASYDQFANFEDRGQQFAALAQS